MYVQYMSYYTLYMHIHIHCIVSVFCRIYHMHVAHIGYICIIYIITYNCSIVIIINVCNYYNQMGPRERR